MAVDKPITEHAKLKAKLIAQIVAPNLNLKDWSSEAHRPSVKATIATVAHIVDEILEQSKK